jgi:FMN phosphatase YigB (HAD superfamily)
MVRSHLPAVLFDLGDVLVHLRFDRGAATLRRLAVDPDLAIDAARTFLGEHALAYNAGQVTPEDFVRGLARAVGQPETPQGLQACREAWCDIFDPWPEMQSLAHEVLDAGHPAWLLSNTDPLHFAYLHERTPVLSRLTGLCLSYELRLAKPDPEYFRSALERVGLPATDALFIDDRPDNVAAARGMGLRSHLHTGDVAAVRTFLTDHGVRLA